MVVDPIQIHDGSGYTLAVVTNILRAYPPILTYDDGAFSTVDVVAYIPRLAWLDARPGPAYAIAWGGDHYAVEPHIIKKAAAIQRRNRTKMRKSPAPLGAATAPALRRRAQTLSPRPTRALVVAPSTAPRTRSTRHKNS